MIAPFPIAELVPHVVGWVLLVTGLGTLAWAWFDWITGQTNIGDDCGRVTRVIHRDQEPVAFRRTIVLVVFAGVVCLAAAGFLGNFGSWLKPPVPKRLPFPVTSLR